MSEREPLPAVQIDPAQLQGYRDFYTDLLGFVPPRIQARTDMLARVDPDGSIHAAADGLMFPNGTVITPDGRTLIIAESFGRRLTAFDIADDGSLSNRRLWADLGHRVPDGICLDADGAIWVANPITPECFRVAAGGEILDVIETDNRCFACMLGGPDLRTLFMLTSRYSLAVEASVQRTGNVLIADVPTAGAGLP